MNLLAKYKNVGALIATALIGIVIGVNSVSVGELQTGSIDIRFDRANSSTSKLVTVASSQILATSSCRSLVHIGAVGGTIYLNMNYDRGAVLYEGVQIASGTTYTINSENLYTGGIRAIAPVSASTTVYEVCDN